MGKYDNYSNQKNIVKIQKKIDRLRAKKKPDMYAIDMLEKDLETAKLFESCQIFGREGFWRNPNHPNRSVMFSDDNEVMMLDDVLIPYSDLESYVFVENNTTKAKTTTTRQGAVSRAIVGGALFGDIGAIVGASSADSKSDTTFYKVVDGFSLRIYLTDKSGYQMSFRGDGMFSNKIPKMWLALGTKLQTIIENNK